MLYKKTSLKKSVLTILASILCMMAGMAYADSRNLNLRIINGQPALRRSLPVVEISIHENDGDYLCSGAMIAPNIAITARHCVSRVASDHTVNVKGVVYGVSKVKIHPLSRELNNGDLIYDVALLYLRRNPNSTYFPIITSRKVHIGDPIFIYGYGLDERGRSGSLRMGQMVVTGSNRRWVYANYVGNGDSNTCEGDSGGPAFGTYHSLHEQQSHYGLIAATAGGDFADCSVGDHSYFTNLQSPETIAFLKSNVPSLALR